MKRSYLIILGLCLVLSLAFVGTVGAKSMYLAANHHTQQFDAWDIDAAGIATYNGDRYTLQYSTDPSGLAIDAIPKDAPTLFITSEFSAGVEMVNPLTLQYMGVSTGPSNLAGIDVDDADNIVYTIRRASNQLYIYSYNADPSNPSITQQAVITLPGLTYGYGLAFDDSRDILWVSDTPNRMIRAYDVSDHSNITLVQSVSIGHPPVDVAVDRYRNIVYTVGSWAGSRYLSKYDVDAGIETLVDLGIGGIGVTVDEITGYVYMTRGTSTSADDVQVWDCSITPATLIQDTGRIGNPAGIVIPQREVSVNPLNLAKNGVIQGTGVSIGSLFPYDISFDNIDNGTYDATNVAVTDIMPAELDFVSSTVGGTPGDGSEYDPATHTVVWDIGTIPAGDQGPFIELLVRVNQNATIGSTIYNHCVIDYTIDGEDGSTDIVDQDPHDPDDEPGINITYPCGDLDHDGDVDGDDRNILRGAFRTSVGDPGYKPEADYDEDGDIDFSDYREWYKCYKAYIYS